MTPHRVFIVGHEGTTGLRIHERLSDRKDIELLATADEDRKNVEAIKVVAKKADIVFLCLPDAASKDIMAEVGYSSRAVRVSYTPRAGPSRYSAGRWVRCRSTKKKQIA